MSAAEKLYTSGFISYPRTETNKYEQSINLKFILGSLTDGSSETGRYADKLLNEEGQYLAPRAGKDNDNAHPPIHPVKKLTGNNIPND